jgi:putative endonuclease
MAKHLETGQSGELIALQYIEDTGYRILAKNWRYKHLEVDIIAMDGSILVFVEVKTRRSSSYGLPHEAVGYRKQQQLDRAANLYISYIKHAGEIRFDIVSILIDSANNHQIEYIKDAFWPE